MLWRKFMFKIIFYTKDDCLLCDEALDMLFAFQDQYPFKIEERDIYTNDEWLLEYQIRIPVIEINGEQLDYEQLNMERLEQILQTAKEDNKV